MKNCGTTVTTMRKQDLCMCQQKFDFLTTYLIVLVVIHFFVIHSCKEAAQLLCLLLIINYYDSNMLDYDFGVLDNNLMVALLANNIPRMA